jgi:hypothetical protein
VTGHLSRTGVLPRDSLMRILPRSPRAICFAAALGWLMLISVTWFAIPPRPRASWSVPDDLEVVGLSADGETVRTVEREDEELPFRTVERQTRNWGDVRLSDRILPGTEQFEIASVSSDGRWLLLKSWVVGRKSFAVVDTTNGEMKLLEYAAVQHLPDGMMPDTGRPDGVFSPDGQLLAIPDQDDGILVWRLPYREKANRFAPADWPVFSPDSRSLAWARPPNRGDDVPSEVVITDIANNTTKTAFCRRGLTGFTADGRGLIFLLSEGGEEPVLECYWLDGRKRWALPLPGCRLEDSGPFLVFIEGDAGEYRAAIYDSNEGTPCRKINLPHHTFWGHSQSPEALVSYETPPEPARIGAFLRQCGLDRVFPVDAGRLSVFDISTGQLKGSVPESEVFGSKLAPNGGAIAVWGPGWLQVWDLPPRKPLTWFAAAAGGFAVPLAGWAGWRSRRLRRKAA